MLIESKPKYRACVFARQIRARSLLQILKLCRKEKLYGAWTRTMKKKKNGQDDELLLRIMLNCLAS